jgi:hypothetical protein
MSKNNTEIQTQPQPLSPALMHAIPGFSTLVSIKLTEDLPAAQQTKVIGHALEVFHHASSMKASALAICLALYHCREAYGEGAVRGKSSKNGWNAFCEANFGQLGLSDGNFRAAVRAGEVMCTMQATNPEGAAIFSRLSRAALFALGDSPELASEVKLILENGDATSKDGEQSNLTAKEIKDLKESLRQQTESATSAEAELTKANDKIRAINELGAEVNKLLTEREDEVIQLRKQNFDLEKMAKTPVESLVPSLPKGVKNEAEMLASLNADIKEKQDKQKKIALEIDAANNRLTSTQRKLAAHDQTADAFKQFDSDISALLIKFPDVLMKMMTDTSKAAKESLTRIAEKLRTLATHIETT